MVWDLLCGSFLDFEVTNSLFALQNSTIVLPSQNTLLEVQQNYGTVESLSINGKQLAKIGISWSAMNE